MRMLKFRLVKDGKIVSTQELKPNGIIDCPVDWDSVYQFTGLLDKQGKEVYEGDILKNIVYGGTYKIEWATDEDYCGYVAITIEPRKGSNTWKGYRNLFTAKNFDNCEIIGNIFEDNKEDGGGKMSKKYKEIICYPNCSDCINYNPLKKFRCGLSCKPTELNGQCSQFKKADFYTGLKREFKVEETMKCKQTDCTYYDVTFGSGCKLPYKPEYDSTVCVQYEEKDNTTCTICPHCGKSLEPKTSLEIAQKIHKELQESFSGNITKNCKTRTRIDKMAENYEEAIIDAIEDERNRIINEAVNIVCDIDRTKYEISENTFNKIRDELVVKLRKLQRGEIK
jgi:uncharacterized phage protein (TIGR01671 family)